MNEDTICLLQQCNSGCKAATNSMEQVLPFTEEKHLQEVIKHYNDIHISIGDECHDMLNHYNCEEKDPSMLAKSFSWITTEVKMIANNSSEQISAIMMDGCHYGIKGIAKYLNHYKNASEESKQLAKKIIQTEQQFMKDLMNFL